MFYFDVIILTNSARDDTAENRKYVTLMQVALRNIMTPGMQRIFCKFPSPRIDVVGT